MDSQGGLGLSNNTFEDVRMKDEEVSRLEILQLVNKGKEEMVTYQAKGIERSNNKKDICTLQPLEVWNFCCGHKAAV